MRVTVETISGPDKGRSFIVRGGEMCRFGRTDRAAELAVRDPQLADPHFVLDGSGQTCRVRDLGTQSGTYVNGERQLEAMIGDGDVIAAGGSQFRIHIEAAEQPIERTLPKFPLPLLAAVNDPSRPFETAIVDEEPDVRREALLAAAWARQPWLLDYCRAASAYPVIEHWDALLLLAILGQSTDLGTILNAGRTADLGPERFQILGAFGHPALVEELLTRIESQDAATAIAAGAAFSKITGLEIEAETEESASAVEQSQQSDDSDPTSETPRDPAFVRRLWNREKHRFQQGSRWCRGIELSRGATQPMLDKLDLESCWEARLRDHFYGIRAACPLGPQEFDA